MEISRQQVEKEFHERHGKIYRGDKELIFEDRAFFYEPSISYPIETLGNLKGKTILDYGCGDGVSSVVLARRGAFVHAFDISSKSIDLAIRRAKVNGVADKVFPRQMAAERLEYSDNMFDAVYGNAIIHHVNLKEASCELHRVMKPGGIATFSEPLGENFILELARKYIPYPNKHRSPTERSLTYKDIWAFAKPFSKVNLFEVQLLEMIRRIIRNKRLIKKLADVDQVLLARVPFLRRYCRGVIITLVK